MFNFFKNLAIWRWKEVKRIPGFLLEARFSQEGKKYPHISFSIPGKDQFVFRLMGLRIQ
jgi:hypothetical protein